MINLFASLCVAGAVQCVSASVQTADFVIRDPCIVPVAQEQNYYLYRPEPKSPMPGVKAFVSKDLKSWTDAGFVCFVPKDFWGKYDFWAPEVHVYRGKYYLFMSFNADREYRGTHIFVSNSPKGPFTPLPDRATPDHWQCLDGTLYIEEDGTPYVVFCHEWTQIHNGTICAQRMSEDLTKRVGTPLLLFSGSAAPWISVEKARPDGKMFPDFVTDGPWLFRNSKGRLFMLWSTFGSKGYTVVLAESSNGRLDGEWIQHSKPIFEGGGHCMVFKDFSGKLHLTLHNQDIRPSDHLRIFDFGEDADGLPVILK